MAFESLTEKLSATFKRLRGKGRLSESDVNPTPLPTHLLPLKKLTKEK